MKKNLFSKRADNNNRKIHEQPQVRQADNNKATERWSEIKKKKLNKVCEYCLAQYDRWGEILHGENQSMEIA